VQWPGADWTEWQDVKADGFYLIEKGKAAKTWQVGD